MTATSSGHPAWIRVAASSLMMIGVGCATNATFDPDQTTIDPESSVVAFSINTEKFVKHGNWVNPKRLHIGHGAESVTVHLNYPKSGTQRALVEVPVGDVEFSDFEIDSGTGLFWKTYHSSIGHPLVLKPGAVTYIGRIEIRDIFLQPNPDGTAGSPYGVEVVLTNALEDDLAAWKQQYRIFDDRTPDPAVIGHWGGATQLRIWSAYTAPGSLRRSRDGRFRDPPRGPRPANKPSPSTPPR